MKKIIIIMVLLFIVTSTLVYFGLSTSSFEGRVSEVKQYGQVEVDCPVPRFGRNVDAIAYLCSVQINEDTIISNSTFAPENILETLKP